MNGMAQRYGRIMSAVYGKEGIRGKVVKVTRGARHLSLGVRLADPRRLDKALSLAEPIALACRVPAVIAQRSKDDPGLVTYQFQLPEHQWKDVTRSDLEGLGVGLSESRRQIDFGFDPPHSGVFGTTGSGKSEATKGILTALFSACSPTDLKAVIVDPNKKFTDLANCAHLAAPIGHDDLQPLVWAGQELARRIGEDQKDAPRLVVAIDEAEETLDEQAMAVVRSIAKRGREYNVSLVLATQDPKEGTLPGILSQVNNRWVGQVANAQVSAWLTGHAGIEAHKLTGKGDFVHVAGPITERLQFALVRPQDLERLPRVVEVPEPVVEPEDIPAVVNSYKGRRPVEIEPTKVATYLYYGPENVSMAQAREHMGLRRVSHERHREFARELQTALGWLEENGGRWD